MNSYYNPELVAAMHRDMIARGAFHREAADIRRRRKARRLSRKAEQLATRAAQLVVETHR